MIAYKISNEASKDLENIWLYTYATWSIHQADRYYNLLLNEIEFIAANPTSGKDCGHIREGYFRSKINSHFIYYKINKDKTEIEIIRILHQQMDVEKRLID